MTDQVKTGTVAWFNETKGYGFITPDVDTGSRDDFVHATALAESGIDPRSFVDGRRVSYVMVERRKRLAATEIKFI